MENGGNDSGAVYMIESDSTSQDEKTEDNEWDQVCKLFFCLLAIWDYPF